jgi:hypothetical protein
VSKVSDLDTVAQSSAAAAAVALPCDSDPSHTATVWCASCESNWCDACDERVHAATRCEQHARTTLATGATRKNRHGHAADEEEPEQPKTKFVVKSSPVSPRAASDHSSPHSAQAVSGPPDQRSKFVVGKFAQPAPAAAAPEVEHRPGSDTLASGTTVGALRIQHTDGPALSHITEDHLGRLGAPELEALWYRFDKDRNNVLGRGEVQQLAEEVIERVVQLVKDDLSRQHPNMTPREIDERAEEEKWFVLPGRNRKETVAEMKRRLSEALDLNKDGRITRQEYTLCWNKFAKSVFVLEEKGEIACAIM